jgi:hypothetical protein
VSDWKRVTREISPEQAPAEIKAEVQRHIELYHLGAILSDTVMCVQSDSGKARKG